MYEKSQELLVSMCLRADHSFGLSCPEIFSDPLFKKDALELSQMQADLVNNLSDSPKKVLDYFTSINQISHILLFKQMNQIYDILSSFGEKLTEKEYDDIANKNDIKINLSQIHEEMIGFGFFSNERKDVYQAINKSVSI